MPNKFRNEVSFTLGDHEYLARPTFKAIAEIESKMGKTLSEFILDISRGVVSINEVYIILYETIKAYGNGIKADELAEDIMANGTQEAAEAAAYVALTAFKGPQEDDEGSKKK